ncbi:MAG: MBL fold metallo-hydrolase [Bacteroidota bacterium]
MQTKITFLGTGTSQGVPLIGCNCEVCTSDDSRDKRLRTSIMIERGETVVVIDSGPDFRQQMLREKVTKLDGLVFTHEHKDHIAGMDDIRAFNFINKKPVDVYCTKQVETALRREFFYAFENDYPGVPELNIFNFDLNEFTIGDITLKPIKVFHAQLEIRGFRIGDFTFITDANYISEEEKMKIVGSKVMVINALRHHSHPTHFNLEQALYLLDELNIEQGFLIHLSHQMGKHEVVSSQLPFNRFIAFDGLQIITNDV